VQTGEAFTINDLKGKVVLVETMAIWCSNCKKQQGQVKALHELLGMREDFVSLGLAIDPNENGDALKSYIDSNGFDWYYAVSSTDVSREIAALYGDQFLNPPSTPMLIIDRKGVAHPLPFGVKSADDLLKALQPFLDEAM
jgi:thiol-disulfide isomerase/thioredoxin